MGNSRNGLARWSSRALGAIPAVLLATACATTSGRTGVQGEPGVVQTESGAVRGVHRNGALEFRGIPFAARPVRWALPQPPAPWSGVRDASAFGGA